MTNLRDMPHVRHLAESISEVCEISVGSAFWQIDSTSYEEVEKLWQEFVGFLPDDPRSRYLQNL